MPRHAAPTLPDALIDRPISDEPVGRHTGPITLPVTDPGLFGARQSGRVAPAPPPRRAAVVEESAEIALPGTPPPVSAARAVGRTMQEVVPTVRPRSLRTGPIPLVPTSAAAAVPAFVKQTVTSQRTRTAVLATCAIAVVGAMSGAAALLPGPGRGDIVRAMPRAAGSSSTTAAGAAVCTTPAVATRTTAPLPSTAATGAPGTTAPVGAMAGADDTLLNEMGDQLDRIERKVRRLVRQHRAPRHLHPVLAPTSETVPDEAPVDQADPTPGDGTAPSRPTPTTSPRPTTSPTRTTTPSASPKPTRTTSPKPTSSGAPAVPTRGTNLRSILAGARDRALLALDAGVYTMHDFDSDLMGADLERGGLRGAGIDRTVLQMAENTSSKRSEVPTKAYTTNQLYLLSTIGGTPGLSGFTLKATKQGHLFNGLRIGKASNARVQDVKILNVPGDKSYPPGETFALNDWRTDGSVYNRITIDSGNVGAAGFGANSSTDLTINDSTFTGTATSSGLAIWQTKDVTMNDVRVVNNRSGINFERSGGRIVLNRPVFRNNDHYDMQFGTDREGGTVTITDPVLEKGQKLVLNVPGDYHGHTNGQKRSNIHVYVNGKDRTDELIRYK